RFLMKRVLTILFCLCGFVLAVHGQDITSLEKIGAVVGYTRNNNGITFNCRDNSQVQLIVLAPDLIRVRAAFAKPIPASDHSWGIAKEKWATPRWSLSETAAAITLATDEVEVVVHRSPLL